MKERDHEDQHAPLSYHGAWRIVWLVFLLIVLWLIVRSLQPVILLFALVFLLAMVMNPIVVWLQKHHIPRFVGVILLVLALLTVTTTIIFFAIPPLARQSQELVRNAPGVCKAFAPALNPSQEIIHLCVRHCRTPMKSQGKSERLPERWETFCYDPRLAWLAAWLALCSQFCCLFLCWPARARW